MYFFEAQQWWELLLFRIPLGTLHLSMVFKSGQTGCRSLTIQHIEWVLVEKYIRDNKHKTFKNFLYKNVWTRNVKLYWKVSLCSQFHSFDNTLIFIVNQKFHSQLSFAVYLPHFNKEVDSTWILLAVWIWQTHCENAAFLCTNLSIIVIRMILVVAINASALFFTYDILKFKLSR